MKFHSIAEIFPMMQGDEFKDLCQDIKDNGLIESIWLHPNGQIIDGRNRYRACLKVGIEPKFRTWKGEGSLIDFVLSLNLHRRHLTGGQKAVLALEVEPLYAEEAKERQATSTGGITPQLKEKIPEADKGQARDKAAKVFGTNGRYVSDVKRIKQSAPKVFEQLKTGEIATVAEAKRIAFQFEKPYNYKRDERSTRPSEIYVPKGYDACQTPGYAIDPILPFLDRDFIIWEPAAGENYLVEALYDGGFKAEQIVISDILTNQNFFEYEPDNWDCLVTNPPYSIKYQWL